MNHELIPTFVCYPIDVLYFQRCFSIEHLNFLIYLPIYDGSSGLNLLSQNINIDLPALLAESQVILLGKDIYYVFRDTRKNKPDHSCQKSPRLILTFHRFFNPIIRFFFSDISYLPFPLKNNTT